MPYGLEGHLRFGQADKEAEIFFGQCAGGISSVNILFMTVVADLQVQPNPNSFPIPLRVAPPLGSHLATLLQLLFGEVAPEMLQPEC